MAIRYEIRSDIVFVDVGEVLDGCDLLRFYDALAADPAFRPRTPLLIDARSVGTAAPFRRLHDAAIESRRTRVFAAATKSAALVSTPWMFRRR
jgi:hypothetical protein